MPLLVAMFLVLVGCQSKGPFYSESHLDFAKWNRTSDCCTSEGKKFAIASGGTYSSKAGADLFNAGGNIVDAAVATAFALAVERPHSAGIGGGGFMTLHLAGTPPVDVFIDFRETAPRAAHRDMYLDKEGKVVPNLSVKGPLSVATPGFVVGLYDVHKKWGKLPWKKVLEPALKLAKEGFPIYLSLAKHLEEEKADLIKDPESKKLFYRENGDPLKLGEKLVQSDLAETIDRIAERGKSDFINGESAKRIAAFVKQKGGILALRDFEKYRPVFREPIRGSFMGFDYLSAPPPSAGGVLIAEILNLLSETKLSEIKHNSVQYTHLLAEVMRRAYADRSQMIGDPDFFKSPYLELTKKEYAKKLVGSINMDKATPSTEVKPVTFSGKEKQHTTHLSIIDSEGNAVASTLTINDTFGAAMVAPGTGVFLNDEMDDFSAKPGEQNIYGLVSGESNSIAPLKRPVSSMSPTIFLKEGRPVLSLGAAGGSRIISSTLQVALNYLLVTEGSLKKAMFSPRMHHQWVPDKLSLEKGLYDEVGDELRKKGHDTALPPWSAIVQSVAVTNGTFTAVFDPRDEGGAFAQ